MFIKEMESLIKFAMTKDIAGLETKVGYNGAPILRISSFVYRDIIQIQEWCNRLEFNSKIIDKTDSDTPEALRENKGYELFCIFGKDAKADEIFDLK